jgi:hypothetical protein
LISRNPTRKKLLPEITQLDRVFEVYMDEQTGADVGPNGGRKFEERFNWEISLWIFWVHLRKVESPSY